jgi:protein-disulfide isomerase
LSYISIIFMLLTGIPPIPINIHSTINPIRRLNLVIPDHAPYVGLKKAPVTIVIFSDFKCPWSKRANKIMRSVKKTFSWDVRYVFMNFPLKRHSGAQIAAEAGLEAMAQGKFAEFKDKIFSNQKSINTKNILKWGGEIGMNIPRLKKALRNRTYQKKVNKQKKIARSIGIRGTPTVIINGRQLTVRGSFSEIEINMKNMVREEIGIIKKRNIPRSKAYALLTQNGLNNLKALTARINKDGNSKKPRMRKVVDPNVVYNILWDFSNEPQKGAKRPLVTIVKFIDFQCPYCARANRVMNKILKFYKKDVRIIYIHNPLKYHKMAMPAAISLLEVMRQKGLSKGYWKLHNHIMENRHELSIDSLVKWAGNMARADSHKVRKAINFKFHENHVKTGMKLGKLFGVHGVPAFFVNGYYVSGARSLASFKLIINRELLKAKRVIRKGWTSRKNVYSYLVGKGLNRAKYIMQKAPISKKRTRPRLDTTKAYRIDVKGLPFIGDRKSPVVMAIAFDIQCPYWNKLMNIVDQLLKGDGGNFMGYKRGLKIVFLHYPLPFHKDAQLAHEAIQEVFNQKGPRGLFTYITLLRKNGRNLPRNILEKHARTVGCNMRRFNSALTNRRHRKLVKNSSLAARKVGVMGTPAVYINGNPIRKRNLKLYRKIIRMESKKAKKYISNHRRVTRAKYYKRIMRKANPKAIWLKP